jgi:hypothetical protein
MPLAVGLGPMAPRRLDRSARCGAHKEQRRSDRARQLRRRHLSGLFDQPGKGELACPVNGNKDVELAFGNLKLGDVDVEEPDRIALEPLPFGLVPFDVR